MVNVARVRLVSQRLLNQFILAPYYSDCSVESVSFSLHDETEGATPTLRANCVSQLTLLFMEKFDERIKLINGVILMIKYRIRVLTVAQI